MSSGMSRARKALSVPTELPASWATPGSGTRERTWSRTAFRACGMDRPPASSSSSPEAVCISRTKSLMRSSAAAGGLMSTSTPSPSGRSS